MISISQLQRLADLFLAQVVSLGHTLLGTVQFRFYEFLGELFAIIAPIIGYTPPQ
jgi:hypothetical protein